MSDPFGGDGDKTILKPMPGGRRPGGEATAGGPPASPPRQAVPTPPPSPGSGAPLDPVAIGGGGENPLVGAAGPLFAMVYQLRTSVSHADPQSLQAHVAQEITTFEAKARQQGEPPEAVLAARYAICTLLDETALSTPWGIESHWASQTLLVRFHNEARGGEKFFQILEQLIQDPARNLHLLEFMYLCLALGFQGRYRLQPQGKDELARVQESVYETLRTFKGELERDLSLRWRGVQDHRSRLAQYVPLWVLGAVGAGIAILVYVGFLFALSADTDPVAAHIAGLGRDTVPIETRAAVRVVQTVTLSDLLSDDAKVAAAVAAGLAQVEESPDRARVRLWGLFPSGEARVAAEHAGLVHDIGRAIGSFNGGIRVVGHTDDIPIRSLRFPSNWILSERRAEAVNGLLAEVLPGGRTSSEGRADTQPLVANDSDINRALNRRIEITLFYEADDL